ncbi:MAG: bifunctional diaminohydroxyphosphoribosylaminopyrimidine deaminase/5-amino-6-(5-phosphoribosylamino)uracil reductase RibD [Lachnospiraceae bacterium]|nr:bifunctional diaminohydroxyphosphoribosylaminopyrimidine deaminase/5-amino-6-(5-phosphoribosylamino)uracil reductase RibD [Lachnospiraceae bacterium]
MEKCKKDSQYYMKKALDLAKQGEGRVSPNPMVGCVAVKDGQVIASGYHEKYGGFHAERNALLHCQEDAEGAELYVTLEPCCHHGKTPPCTDIIIEKKIGKVYVGCLDCNPKVAGNGVKILREHGIEVEVGILEKECRKINEVFFHYMDGKLPFVAMKYAMTLDGKIACETGDARWVTGEEARGFVQRLRNRYRGIMAGIGTVLMDDPLLNCRMEGGRDPLRIICDTKLRIPRSSQIVETAREIETVVAWNPQAAEAFRQPQPCGDAVRQAGERLSPVKESVEYLTDKNILLLETPLQKNNFGQGLDLRQLLRQLGERGIDSILLEGGGTLNGSALQENLVQRVYAFVAPKLIAGADAKSPVEGIGIPRMKDAVELQDIEIIPAGRDICITGRIEKEGKCLPES